MERIKVSDNWRFLHTDSTFEMKFSAEADKSKALDAIRTAIKAIDYENGYSDLWLQDLEDCTLMNGFEIESTLWSDEFNRYIPAMCKAVAAALPGVPFSGSACHDSLKCNYIDSFEFSYDGAILHIKETFEDDDCGYFCPECGEWVANVYHEFESDEVECFDCEETVRVSDLKFVPPTVTEEIVEIA